MRKAVRSLQLRKFGLTEADFAAMTLAQGGVCAICLRLPRAPDTRLCIDHDHDTGQFRGLLCRSCNGALGLLGDDVSAVQRAVAYLENYAVEAKEA
jgi:hypothetical protein